jgi:hypothetical protein
MDENSFAHDKSPYERPDAPFRCGRGVFWKKPCHQGPYVDGRCGGTSECTPLLKGDRWQCKRPNSAGGPCADGPTPQGECSFHRLPCSPWPTLRVIRGRLALLAIISIAALVGTSQAFDQIESRFFSSSDARHLTKAHKNFSEEKGCSTCHVAHGKGPVEWAKAIFTKTNLSDNCVNCHAFAGPSSKAHNGDTNKYPNLQDTQCHMCHQEHKGDQLNSNLLTSKQCNFCHKTKFESFSNGHPEFPEKYPYLQRNTINFDHVTHLRKYFEDSKHSDNAPEKCTGCHLLTLAGRAVRSDGFDVICGKCHSKDIAKNKLNLLRLPEFNENRMDEKAVLQACNIETENMQVKIKKSTEEDFLSVSTDVVTKVSAYLLNLEENDPDAYGQKLQDLIMAMTEEGTAPMADLIEQFSGKSQADKLLAGLNPEVLKRAACAWALNLEYEPPAAAKYGGWFADLIDVGYAPLEHGDPVAKNWIEFALAAASNQDDDIRLKNAVAMRDQILSPKKGVGACAKCHAVTAHKNGNGKDELLMEWKIKWPREKPYVYYAHDKHINILGIADSCANCHVIDNKADYSSSFKNFDATQFTSNFKPIERGLCVQCHSEDQISQECQLCHIYHLNSGFKSDMTAVKTIIHKKEP